MPAVSGPVLPRLDCHFAHFILRRFGKMRRMAHALTTKRCLQIMVVAGAACAAAWLVGRDRAIMTGSDRFDMLGYVDSRVAQQENVKDVRCWSSFCKLQMFLTGARIEEEAIGVRIEKHRDLIESIWRSAASGARRQGVIGREEVVSLLRERFPSQPDPERGVAYRLQGGVELIRIDADAVQDYSDTIEPWRLLQSWASRHTDAEGKFNLAHVFDEQALNALADFLKTYDLAILQHARRIAADEKKARIDAVAMSRAFDLESMLRE